MSDVVTVQQADVDPGFEVHYVLDKGRAELPSSGGLARRLLTCIRQANDAEEELEAAVSNGADAATITALQDQRDYCLSKIRQCEWQFGLSKFKPSDLETTSKNRKRSRKGKTQSPTGRPMSSAMPNATAGAHPTPTQELQEAARNWFDPAAIRQRQQRNSPAAVIRPPTVISWPAVNPVFFGANAEETASGLQATQV
jgi:hypothetical protein